MAPNNDFKRDNLLRKLRLKSALGGPFGQREIGAFVIASLTVEPEIRNVLEEYFRQVDLSLPGMIEGFYVVGSTALGDYVPGISDIDFVAVSSENLQDHEIDVLAVIHKRLAERSSYPKLDGIYTTWSALAATTKGATAHHWLDKTMHRNSLYGANPVTWATIQKHPLVIRGNPNPEIFHSDSELRDWCMANLQSYWVNWVNASSRFGLKFFASFSLEAICWGVLGVIRLHATIRTGEIISKTQAFGYGSTVFPEEWQSILKLALSRRRPQTNQQRIGPIRRRSKALDFMKYAIVDVLS